jgi:hypothetical protein
MMNADCDEHLWRTVRLVRLHPNFVVGDLLAVFLAKNGDHVERSATGKAGGNQLNWFEARSPGAIVQPEIVLAARATNCLYWLSGCVPSTFAEIMGAMLGDLVQPHG